MGESVSGGGAMIVYVVESGEHSDYHIDAIFEAEEMAKAFVEAKGGDSYRAWELDTWRPNQGEWCFGFDPKTGNIVTEAQKSSLQVPTLEVSSHSYHWRDPISISVKTGDRERAVKIASERYARIMSQMDNAKVLLEKASDWYTPYPPGHCISPHGVAVEIAEILAGIKPLPVGSEWVDKEGKQRFGYSMHQEHLYRIMGVPYARQPQ